MRKSYAADRDAERILRESYGINADAFVVTYNGTKTLVINPADPFNPIFRNRIVLDNIRHDIIGTHDGVVAYLSSHFLAPEFLRL
ncbi:MAG TPA: hypothetical protein VJI12_01175 [archaeon]|nr:hypothetical protein [archaeon]